MRLQNYRTGWHEVEPYLQSRFFRSLDYCRFDLCIKRTRKGWLDLPDAWHYVKFHITVRIGRLAPCFGAICRGYSCAGKRESAAFVDNSHDESSGCSRRDATQGKQQRCRECEFAHDDVTPNGSAVSRTNPHATE